MSDIYALLDSVNLETTITQTIETDLNNYLKEMGKKENSLSRYGGDYVMGHHPSSISDSECPRHLFYAFKEQIEKNISGDLVNTYETGHLIHDKYQNYLAKMKKLKGYWKCGEHFKLCDEVRFYPEDITCPVCGEKNWKYLEIRLSDKELRIEGKGDGILYCDRDIVFELKSWNGFQFKELTQPLLKHRKQLNLYMDMLEIYEGLILYENKDTGRRKWFYEKYDPSLIKPIKERLLYVNKCLDENIIPVCNYGCETCKKCTPGKFNCRKDFALSENIYASA